MRNARSRYHDLMYRVSRCTDALEPHVPGQCESKAYLSYYGTPFACQNCLPSVHDGHRCAPHAPLTAPKPDAVLRGVRLFVERNAVPACLADEGSSCLSSAGVLALLLLPSPPFAAPTHSIRTFRRSEPLAMADMDGLALLLVRSRASGPCNTMPCHAMPAAVEGEHAMPGACTEPSTLHRPALSTSSPPTHPDWTRPHRPTQGRSRHCHRASTGLQLAISFVARPMAPVAACLDFAPARQHRRYSLGTLPVIPL